MHSRDAHIDSVEPVFGERARERERDRESTTERERDRERERERAFSNGLYGSHAWGSSNRTRHRVGIALRKSQLHSELDQGFWTFKDKQVARRVVECALLQPAYGIKT